MFKLNQKSIEKLKLVEPKLKLLVDEVIKITLYNFTITEGLRTLKHNKSIIIKGLADVME